MRHKVHPNQLSAWKQRAVEGIKEVFIDRPNHVWSSISPTSPSRKVPVPGGGHGLGNSPGALLQALQHPRRRFCTEALTEALERYGRPEIFNSDQGSQFTCLEFTSALQDAGIAISMDGRGRCLAPLPVPPGQHNVLNRTLAS